MMGLPMLPSLLIFLITKATRFSSCGSAGLAYPACCDSRQSGRSVEHSEVEDGVQVGNYFAGISICTCTVGAKAIQHDKPSPI